VEPSGNWDGTKLENGAKKRKLKVETSGKWGIDRWNQGGTKVETGVEIRRQTLKTQSGFLCHLVQLPASFRYSFELFGNNYLNLLLPYLKWARVIVRVSLIPLIPLNKAILHVYSTVTLLFPP